MKALSLQLSTMLKKNEYYSFYVLAKFFLNIYLLICTASKQVMSECKKIWLYFKRKRVIDEYLQSHDVRKLQIGSGANPPSGWLNTDLYPQSEKTIFLDATARFPFCDQTFDYVFCEHMIEHISYNEGLRMLGECFRILKRGGRIRLSTPDLKVYLDLFTEVKTDIQRRYVKWISSNWLAKQKIFSENETFILNLVMHGWGHLFVYDFETLKRALTGAGFIDIRQYTCGLSDDDNFKGLEGHGKFIGNVEMNEYETLVLEAMKPSQ